jgi:hypothetical protein
MDDQRFDDLVKRFCTIRLTRLSALRGLAGGAAALAGAVLASDDSEAKKKARGQSKKKARGQSKKKSRAQSQNKRVRSQSQDLTAQQVEANATCRAFNETCQENPGKGNDCCTDEALCTDDGLPGHGTCHCPDTLPDYCANNDSCYSPAEGECCIDGDCETGEICNNQNTCVPECDPPCDPGEICNNGICEPECENNDDCDPGEICNNGICEPDCGEFGEPCCPGPGDGCDGDLVCDNSQNPDICVECTVDAHCGQNNVCCNNECFQGECCDNADCPGETCVNHECVSTPPGPGPGPTTCPAGSVLSGGRCLQFGIKCKSGETALKCCFRSVKKGCARKQSSNHAKRNCIKRGKKRCKKLLAGV